MLTVLRPSEGCPPGPYRTLFLCRLRRLQDFPLRRNDVRLYQRLSHRRSHLSSHRGLSNRHLSVCVRYCFLHFLVVRANLLRPLRTLSPRRPSGNCTQNLLSCSTNSIPRCFCCSHCFRLLAARTSNQSSSLLFLFFYVCLR